MDEFNLNLIKGILPKIMALLKKVNIYQRIFLFSFTMSMLWWLVELASFHPIEYVINNPKVLYNTFAKRQAVWIMTGSLVGFFIFKTSKK